MTFAKKIDLDYIITFFFLMLTANANFLSSSTIGWFVIMALMIIVGVSRKQFNKEDMQHIFIFTLCYSFYVLFRFFLINDLAPDYLGSDMIFLCKYVFLAFVVATVLKERAIAYIVKVTTHLTVISFVFYALQLLSHETMYRTFSAINFPTGNEIPGYTNVLFFTFTQGFHDFSNSGFVWEPGSFGCFLVITLMFHFFLNRFKFDGTAIILIIGNISTFSTTNYLGLLVLLFLAYRYRVPKINLWVLIMIPVCILLVIFIPFLGDKIIETYSEDMRDLNHLRVLEKYYRHNRMQIPLNRFSSMWHIMDSFGNKLIMGVSNKYNEILNKSYTVNISNGVFDFFAKFGVLGFLYLAFRYGRFCKTFVSKNENVAYCLGILLITSFGEPILALPFILIFMFFSREQVPLVKIQQRRRTLQDMGY
ncbi:hypothetical protein FPZ43_14040 [Mucilaginibacter pallidiroseus]|uniref:Uncharacterized protein n=1 Tax=Mucilaginibacter pallidiroseus TaxID=2599295 RepID=A0A563U8D5_9SPHI|nr:hypothetical protein [Mucilaginibacter pallidiroseus]TWR27586.1 hypothetical protein FPZ43_14040 [Mucilaginibacter pallidiroseus]